MMPSIEFVYFDLGNILVTFDHQIAITNVASRFGLPADRVEQTLYHSGIQERFEHGHVTGEEFAMFLRSEFGLTESEMPTADVLDACSDMFAPIESMWEPFSRVRDSGIAFGVLSNTCHAHWDWIGKQTWQIAKVSWEIRVLSCEVGSMKPHHGIYEEAEKAAKVPVSSILFLDDKPENVAAAIARGWNAVQCFGGEQAEAALRHFAVIA
ncbi:HAD-IA family hydrolase [Novipirellula herctigrandis]